MSISFEKPETTAEGNWSEYMFELGDFAERKEWDDLEALLLIPHPLVPGEREAYDELAAAFAAEGRELRVQIDPRNYKHIIPID